MEPLVWFKGSSDVNSGYQNPMEKQCRYSGKKNIIKVAAVKIGNFTKDLRIGEEAKVLTCTWEYSDLHVRSSSCVNGYLQRKNVERTLIT